MISVTPSSCRTFCIPCRLLPLPQQLPIQRSSTKTSHYHVICSILVPTSGRYQRLDINGYFVVFDRHILPVRSALLKNNRAARAATGSVGHKCITVMRISFRTLTGTTFDTSFLVRGRAIEAADPSASWLLLRSIG